MNDQDPKTSEANVSSDEAKIKADGERFLNTTKENPPNRKKAVELFQRYVKVLQSLDASQWKRFFALLNKEKEPVELTMSNPAVAAVSPADHAYCLLLKIGELDVSWWNRYWKRLTKAGAWIVGVPLVGSALEWLWENWDKLPFISQGPMDIFQSEEYVFLSLTGVWMALLIESRKLR